MLGHGLSHLSSHLASARAPSLGSFPGFPAQPAQVHDRAQQVIHPGRQGAAVHLHRRHLVGVAILEPRAGGERLAQQVIQAP